MQKLEREVATHHAGAEELNREHAARVDALREEKALLEVCLEGGVRGVFRERGGSVCYLSDSFI